MATACGLLTPSFPLIEEREAREVVLDFLEKELHINCMFANRADILNVFLPMNKINH